jgi:hypothetical protein
VGNRSHQERRTLSPKRSVRSRLEAPAGAMTGCQGRVPVGWQDPLPESSTLSSTPTKRQW